ncbi:MAG: hypothetical protein NTX22_15255 [Ignavibacteriales bacterium]|nr:hypothetical protein [Ignavibacteriales bacterium]
MVKKVLLAIFVIGFTFISVKAQSVSVKASVDSSRYLVGDFINYSIIINHPKDVSVNSPSIKDSLKGIDLIKIEPVATEEKDGSVTSTFKFILAKYDSGDVHIPAIPIIYNRKGNQAKETTLTNTVYLTVSTLNVNPQSDIKDVKEPIKIPLDWRLILMWSLIALVIIAAGVYGFLYYRKKRLQKLGIIEEIKREPYEIALEELKLLEEKKLWQQGRIKEYHTEVTGIIRKYFEGRFLVPALEITTDELLNGLNGVADAESITKITSDFLNNADLVKFAKFVPMNDVNEEMLKQAYQIVNDTMHKTEDNMQIESEVVDVH